MDIHDASPGSIVRAKDGTLFKVGKHVRERRPTIGMCYVLRATDVATGKLAKFMREFEVELISEGSNKCTT